MVNSSKGLTVKLIISKNEEAGIAGDNKNDESQLSHQQQKYKLTVESSGKYSRKATYEDVQRYIAKKKDGEEEKDDDGPAPAPPVVVNSSLLKKWIVEYQSRCFPDDLQEDNHVPEKAFMRDEKKVCDVYKSFGWKPVKLNLKPAGEVVTKKTYSREVCLKTLPYDHVRSKQDVLDEIEKDDNNQVEVVTSYLKKSNVRGHPLAIDLLAGRMDDETNVVTECGIPGSTTFAALGGDNHTHFFCSSSASPSGETILTPPNSPGGGGGRRRRQSSSWAIDNNNHNNDGMSVSTNGTGSRSGINNNNNNKAGGGGKIWKDTKSLRAILQDVEFPTKRAGGNSRDATYKIVATECFVRARVYYRAFFTGDVAADHTDGNFKGERYWKYPMKFLLQYNDYAPGPAGVLLYEDVELKFYTDIKVTLDHSEYEWTNQSGGWQKQKVSPTAPAAAPSDDDDDDSDEYGSEQDDNAGGGEEEEEQPGDDIDNDRHIRRVTFEEKQIHQQQQQPIPVL